MAGEAAPSRTAPFGRDLDRSVQCSIDAASGPSGAASIRFQAVDTVMVLIAEFSFPSDAFALSDALEQFPDVVVEAGRIAAHSPSATLPVLWASEGDLEGFLAALPEDPSVEEVQASVEFDEEVLLHLVWTDPVREFVEEMIDHKGTVLEASATDGRWRVRLRFVTRAQFEEFREYYDEDETAFHLEQLFEPERPRQEAGDVTPEQHAALVTAAESGYFDVPRSVSIQELADELDVSHQAVSERLRRGTANLVGGTLLPKSEDGP